METLFARRRVLFAALCCLTAAACAHRGAAPGAQVTGVSAAFTPPGGQEEEADAQASTQDGQAGASALLERALEALQADHPALAAVALQAALATGDLNEAGRTLAYWYVYVAEQAMGHERKAHGALSDFVATGEDVLLLRRDLRFAEREGSDFVDRFDLPGRLARSRATLSLAWAKQVPAFGRSLHQAVPVRSDEEMAYFIELAPPCAHRLDRQVKEETVAPPAGGDGTVTKVALSCTGLGAPALYYFASQRGHVSRPAPLPPSLRRSAGARKRSLAIH